MNIKWFEKTVEYAFVRQFSDFLASPLDGELETTGDTIFAKNNSFFLVEFKKSITNHCVVSEQKKYADYQKSANILQKYEAHTCHFVIALHYSQKPQSLALCIANYCDFLNNTHKPAPLTDKEQLTKKSIPYQGFKDYLKIVIQEKLANKNEEGSFGILQQLNNIAVIDSQGQVASIVEAVKYFGLENDLQLSQKAEKSYESSRSIGGPTL